jgi:hypothetical protein
MPNTYTPIATQTLGSAAASVTFSSIPGSYTDLILIIDGTSANDSNGGIRFNGDTTSNYSWTRLQGNGSTSTSARASNDTSIQSFTVGTSTGGAGAAVIQIFNYANTTTLKTLLTRHGAASVVVRAIVGLWRKTPEAITSITIVTDNANFAIGSTFTLYGIKAA